jgi:hypothetical protein
MKKLALGWVLLIAAVVACSDDETTSDGSFGSTCMTVAETGSTECDSGVCTDTFDQIGHPVCSQKCTDASMCPEGSEGKKCNMKGYCKP